MIPRPYQADCLTRTDAAFDQYDRVLDVLPTGAGKTIVFSHIAAQRLEGGEKTLILAHREELIEQAIAKLHAATGIVAEKEKAEHRASLQAPVVVASIQSMTRRLANWPKDHFGLVVCDEAHHALSSTWQNVLNHFDAQVLGVTATPDRGDCRNLGTFFQTIGYEISLFDLINQGYLSPIALKSIPLQIDLNAVKSIGGDFSADDIGSAIEPHLDKIADSIRIHAAGRRTLAFLPLISTSKKFVAACNKAGIRAGHVDGESPNRKEILDSFAAGDFELLSNAMLLTEGYDVDSEPTGIGIDCVVVLRPTRSRPLYAQMVGRGTRTAAFKDNLLLLDFLWMHEKHSIVRPASLISKGKIEADEITAKAMELSACLPGDVADQLPLLDLEKVVSTLQEDKLRRELEAQKHREATTISPEQMASFYRNPELSHFEPTMPADFRPVTDKQMEWLKKARINDAGKVFLRGSPKDAKPLDLSKITSETHAAKILTTLFDRKNQGVLMASPAQKAKMRQMQHPGWEHATADDARKFFAGLRNKQPNFV